jgi:RHS repeat-associated protein
MLVRLTHCMVVLAIVLAIVAPAFAHTPPTSFAPELDLRDAVQAEPREQSLPFFSLTAFDDVTHIDLPPPALSDRLEARLDAITNDHASTRTSLPVLAVSAELASALLPSSEDNNFNENRELGLKTRWGTAFQALPFWEPVTGAIYVRNRWYSPATGTFLSPDPLGYVDSANLYTFAGGDPVNGRDPRGLADDNKPSCLGLGNKSCSELWAEASKVWFEPIDAVTTGSKELDQKLKSAAKKPVQVMLAPADMVMNVGVSPGKLVDRMDHALLGGGPAFGAEEGDFALTEGTVNDALMVLAPLEMLEGGLEVPSNFRRSTRSVKARHPDVGIQWGKGVQLQGMPWEDYLERQLPAGSRLPKNFKSFDFFADESGVAISAKTLDTSTLAKLKDPRQVYTSLKRNIDAAANFTSYELKGVSLSSDMITAREVHVAVPSSTTAEQWKEIKRAVDYGRGEGVKVIVTAVR